MAYFVETEDFDPETLTTLGTALDQAWMRVKANHLNGSAYRGPNRTCPTYFRYGQTGRA